MELTIKTTKGSTIRLHTTVTGSVSVDVNGKPHTAGHDGSVKLANDRDAGDHITLAGKVRAQVLADDIPAIRAFFAAAATAAAAYLKAAAAEYAASDECFNNKMAARMYGRNSIH